MRWPLWRNRRGAAMRWPFDPGIRTEDRALPVPCLDAVDIFSGAIAAAAVLSGSAVKVGVIGLIRFLPFETGMPGWGEALAIVGVLSAYYGVLVGITQSNPKTILAYSSVSQMGLLAAILGMGLSAGDQSAPLIATFSAVFHVLVKGGLFLALGVVAPMRRGSGSCLCPPRCLRLALAAFLSPAALAKSLAKPVLGDGDRHPRFAGGHRKHAFDAAFFAPDVGADQRGRHSGSRAAWLVTAIVAIILPWIIYPDATDAPLQDALAPKRYGVHSGPSRSAHFSVLRFGVGVICCRAFPPGICLKQMPEPSCYA